MTAGEPMDRLLVATLNIRNLADRWVESAGRPERGNSLGEAGR